MSRTRAEGEDLSPCQELEKAAGKPGKFTYSSYFCLKLDDKSCICASSNIKL